MILPQAPRWHLQCLALLLVCGTISAELLTSPRDCCGMLIMDSTNKVLLDETSVVSPGLYLSIVVFFCTPDPLYVQLWRKLPQSAGEERFSLVSQQYLVPDTNAIGDTQEFALDSPWTVPDDDFTYIFGFYSVFIIDSSNPLRDQKISIPYTFGTEYSLYTSKQSFLDQQLDIAKSVIKEGLKWPRTMKNFVTLCESLNCALSADDPTDGNGGNTGNSGNNGGNNGDNTTPVGPDGGGNSGTECCNEPGPPGPPGPPGSFDSVDGTISCDVPDTVSNDLTDQKKKLNEMDDKINQIDSLLRGLTDSNFVTGLCPTGFLSGTYGVGSCYVVYKEKLQMGQAVLRCRDDHAATLLSIETELEENFIKSLINNITARQTGTQSEMFWTSGMFNKKGGLWVWYDESTRTKRVMNYRNWQDGTEPVPVNDDDVCMTLVMDYENNIDYWINKVCSTRGYYICEIPKSCL